MRRPYDPYIRHLNGLLMLTIVVLTFCFIFS